MEGFSHSHRELIRIPYLSIIVFESNCYFFNPMGKKMKQNPPFPPTSHTWVLPFAFLYRPVLCFIAPSSHLLLLWETRILSDVNLWAAEKFPIGFHCGDLCVTSWLDGSSLNLITWRWAEKTELALLSRPQAQPVTLLSYTSLSSLSQTLFSFSLLTLVSLP